MSRILIVVGLALLFGFECAAQVATAEISGTILDAARAAVANAKVTATNTETNVSQERTSDATGNYTITLLPPGGFTLTVEAPGFRNWSAPGWCWK